MKRKATIAALLLAAGAGLAAARVGYVALHWAYFLGEPLEILKLWKGGFLLLPGIAAALLATLLLARRSRLPAGLALMPLLGGLLAWGAMHLPPAERGPLVTLPDLALQTLSAGPVRLHDYRGRPLVINLWASWCPPCRQEMPALAAGAAANPDMDFLFLNQGEAAGIISRYLAEEELQLIHVLRDPGSSASKRLEARAMPTTLFFAADGRLIDAYTGELTPPRLADYLRALRKAGR